MGFFAKSLLKNFEIHENLKKHLSQNSYLWALDHLVNWQFKRKNDCLQLWSLKIYYGVNCDKKSHCDS